MNHRTIFSTVTSQIPFVNNTDGNRVQMASSMIRQSQLLLKRELPLIITEDSLIYADSFALQKAKKSGVILDKYNSLILVRYDDGEEDVYIVDLCCTCSYNIGDRFKEGDIIVHHKAIDLNTMIPMLGVNANVVFSSEDSKTFEDAVVLTEEGQNLFTYEYPLKISLEFGKEILEIDPSLSIQSFVKKGTPLIKRQKVFSSLQSIIDFDYDVIYAPDDMVIKEIETHYKQEFLQIQHPSVQKFFKDYSDFEGLHPLLKRFAKKAVSFDGYAYLSIKAVLRKQVRLGDKFANFYGNKGVVSYISPNFTLYDEKNDIRFVPHVIHTPVGVPSRMNIGQIFYMSLGYLLKYVVPKKLAKLKTLEDKVSFLVNFYKQLDKHYALKLVKRLKSMDPKLVSSYVYDIEKSGFRIVLPSFTYKIAYKIYDLYKQLDTPTTFKREGSDIRLGAGVIYTILLEHLAWKKLKAVSVGKHDSKTLQPSDGQRMGEMEMWTLISHNALNMLKESLTIRSDDIKNKKQVINELIKHGKSTLKDKKIYSPTYDLFKAYMILLGVELEDD